MRTIATPGISAAIPGIITVQIDLTGRDAPARPEQPTARPTIAGRPEQIDDAPDIPAPPPPPPSPPPAIPSTPPAVSAHPSEPKHKASPPPAPAAQYPIDTTQSPAGPTPAPTASVTVIQPATPVDDDGDRALAALLALVLLIVMIVVLVHVWYQRHPGARRDLTEAQWRAMWGGSTGQRQRRAARRGGGRLAVLSPEVVEADERRRLMEAHLRDQLAGEIEESYAKGAEKGFDIGYQAGQLDERGRSES